MSFRDALIHRSVARSARATPAGSPRKQMRFDALAYTTKKQQTRREKLLAKLDGVVPRKALPCLIDKRASNSCKATRPPMPPRVKLRNHRMQHAHKHRSVARLQRRERRGSLSASRRATRPPIHPVDQGLDRPALGLKSARCKRVAAADLALFKATLEPAHALR